MLKHWIIIIISLFVFSGVFALDPGKAVTQYTIDAWNDESGLPQNTVRTILQTGGGYLWIGTEEGLARFDGTKFTIFDENNTPAITKNFVYSLFEDSRENLWIGTLGGGLLRYKNGKFKRFGKEEGLSNNFVHCICEDGKKNLWIGTDGGGLFQFNGSRFKIYTTEKELPHNTVRAVCFDHEGNLWTGTSKGLACFKNNTFIKCSEKEGLPHTAINTIFEDSSCHLWIGTDTGLYRREQGMFKQPKTGTGLEQRKVYTIFEDSHKNIWVGTAAHGLIRYSGAVFSVLTKKDGLADDVILSITEDREGSLWIGTAYSGLNRLKDGKFTTFTTKEGLSNDIVFPIYEDRGGYLWIGTNNGLNRYKDGQFMYFTTRNGLTDNVIDSVYEDRRGFLWVGTDDGANRLINSPAGIFKRGEYARKQYILSISGDKTGTLWLGTLEGIIKIKGRTLQELSVKDGLASNTINFIYEDSGGNLWISTLRGGLTKYNDGKFTLYTQADGLAGNSLNCIYEDDDYVFWIGSNSGLSRLKGGKFTAFTKKDGLFNDNIYQVLEDNRANLWMSCNKGIFRVRKKDLNDFAEGKIDGIEFDAFNKDDGMRSSECNGGFQSAGCKTMDGKLWFPTTKGVVVIDPDNIKTNKILPPVYIEGILLDGVSAALGRKVVLKPGVKHLEINFTALSFLNPKKVKFKYRLEGYDDRWIDAGGQRTAWYTNLDAGSYRFHVTACNDDGLWNDKGAAIAVTVVPPFWKTWWFTLFALLVFAVLSYFIIHFFRRYITLAGFWKKQKYVGQFKLLDKIGSGGMGTVYKASNLMDKSEKVAIKVLREEMFSDDSSRKRFKQEAAIIDQLDHPNIVKVLERGQSKHNLYIAMELLEGKTLTTKISETRKPDAKEVLHIMIQVASALEKIHSKNIIHRDLKPDNIMLIDRNGDPNFVKLLDFGLARMQYQTRLTQTGTVIGTINYMAPEQVEGKGSSAASDIFALGTIFYEMLTGERPFIGETSIDIMKQILDKSPIAPIRFRPDISFELNHLIMKMLAKDEKTRPVIREVEEKLAAIDLNFISVDTAGAAV